MLFAYNTMSRIALISDIHANLPALEAVMKDIEQLQCNAVYCLGDVVGYNANPSECLEFIRSRQIPPCAATMMRKPLEKTIRQG